MPQFFLDVFDDEIIDIDENGLELVDLEDALEQARSFLADIIFEPPIEGRRPTLMIQVRDGEGQHVGTVSRGTPR
jgi:hypothetical protein